MLFSLKEMFWSYQYFTVLVVIYGISNAIVLEIP